MTEVEHLPGVMMGAEMKLLQVVEPCLAAMIDT